MAVLNNYAYEMAKASNGESFVTISHLTVGTDAITVDLDDTVLSGEAGPRKATTGSRTLNTVEVSAIRLSTDVITTATGDDLKSVGTFSADTGGTMFTEHSIGGLLQTTSYEVEFVDVVNFVPK